MNTQQAQLLRWVLVETSHPGNVGSAARALKTMGFADLALVRPDMKEIHKHADAIALASGAADVLDGAQVYSQMSDAIGDCTVVLGLTSRDREFGPPPDRKSTRLNFSH